MKSFYRIIGRRGNSTIPFALRMELGIHPDDLVSYTRDGNRIIIRKERICDSCGGAPNNSDYMDTTELKELLSELPHEAQQEALFYLAAALRGKSRVTSHA